MQHIKYYILLIYLVASANFALAFSVSSVTDDSGALLQCPWVSNQSKPHVPTHGLYGRHLSLWASHGIYFNTLKGQWEWQRPNLFCTREDLLTPSFVYPFLIPMLENAGAVVWTPRERDMQPHMSISEGPSIETDREYIWEMQVPENGDYAVYTWYPSVPEATSSAIYTINRGAHNTKVKVNQQMGADTWVYLGTYHFGDYSGAQQSEPVSATISLAKSSNPAGIAIPGKIRLGGGMGHIGRRMPTDSISTPLFSSMPHYLEAARYYSEWAGLPDSLFNTELGAGDYKDDLRSRSNMLNWLKTDKRVPFDLSLAVHTDAGFRSEDLPYGSLAVCTTTDADGRTIYPDSTPRRTALDFASQLLHQINNDLCDLEWFSRELRDRNYSETRSPQVPSAIIEMLSHQHFYDCRLAHDPVFKFRMSRAIYKAILRYLYKSKNLGKPIIQPLPIRNFSASLDKNEARLSWKSTLDTLEFSAKPTHYIIYTRVDDDAFDNGTLTETPRYQIPIKPGHRFTFYVTAANEGGESFPSNQLTVYIPKDYDYQEDARKQVVLVDAFTRLSGPAYISSPDSLGFLLQNDLGVPYHQTMEFSGRQTLFSRTNTKREGEGALGSSTDELLGSIIHGNTFDICAQKARTLVLSDSTVAITSVSVAALSEDYAERTIMDRSVYQRAYMPSGIAVPTIYYLAGMQKRASHNMLDYPVWPKSVRPAIEYLHNAGARIIAEGHYISPHLLSEEERRWWETLKVGSIN